MQPLNPFLAAFFRPGNPIVGQCSPVHHYIILVPTAEFLLTSRETEAGSSTAEVIASEDFLGSHVLKIPSSAATAGGKDAGVGNLRELRGKARQYNTVNGRSVVIKDAFVYSNKGFRTLAQAQILGDILWYADALEPRQWLIYYISRPLVGTWEEVPIPKAIFMEGMAKFVEAEVKEAAAIENGEPSLPRKKEIKSFHDLLNHFPAIARQMQPGLEKLFREFTTVFERPLPPPPSASHIPDPMPDGPIATAMKKVRSNSVSVRRQSLHSLNGADSGRLARSFFSEEDEDVMRASLETAVTTAIDLFQNVDKQQLSMLGATTELTGPLVERLIERYVAENVHNFIWTRLAAMRRQEDLELEAKIRQMEHIDISQLGLAIEGGLPEKHLLVVSLGRAVGEFGKMTTALCPQEMMELLLSTMKSVTNLTEQTRPEISGASGAEKPPLTINADTLVSLLLFVVIRAGVKNLQARLNYIRHFIFIDDVESGEMGYAVSTFEAVLSYLQRDSSGLRRASRRNKALWDAASKGELWDLKRIMDPDADAVEDDIEDEVDQSPASSRAPSVSWSMVNGSSRRSSGTYTMSEPYSKGSGLSHVFPFQTDGMTDAQGPFRKRVKKVSMDVRSMSSGSEYSYRSRATSIVTTGSGLEGDTSVARLCQTQDSSGESVPMMAVQNTRPETLRYLLSLKELYPPEMILQDVNNSNTTLLNAAVQLGHTELIDIILDFVVSSTSSVQIKNYLALQDNMDYYAMVEAGLEAATGAQGDGQPLHLDDHVDSKGNTLLHIVHDALLIMKILQQCDVDVNATNEKKFTALMVASKYGRFDVVRSLYGDPRVDVAAKELRGLTAVELAKDDEVRNRIDDLTLFSMPSGDDSRVTGVVRSFFVEDATIRLVIKSGAPNNDNSFTVTTCRRSMADFERLAHLLSIENPASWIPNPAGQRSPFQIPSKPSRAVLKDIQTRTDWFLKILLAHPTFATHEMLWEFFLVPDLQAEMMEQRSRLKAETRAEKVREEMEPLEDMREVEQFVDHARDMVRSVNYSTKSVARRSNALSVVSNDLYDATALLSKQVSNLAFLPQTYISAIETYTRNLCPQASLPSTTLHSSLLALQSTISAMLAALARPPQLVAQIISTRKSIERSYNSLSRSTRWPLGLLDETRQRMNEEKEERAKEKVKEVEEIGRELRYTQQVVAGELAGWQEMHEKMARRAIREYARGMVVQERCRLEGLRRAIRRLKEVDPGPVEHPVATQVDGVVDELEMIKAKQGHAANEEVQAVRAASVTQEDMPGGEPLIPFENGISQGMPTSSSEGGESSAMGAAGGSSMNATL
ncbi:hypothetical protein PG995_016360 [Apiospora arundinis]